MSDQTSVPRFTPLGYVDHLSNPVQKLQYTIANVLVTLVRIEVLQQNQGGDTFTLTKDDLDCLKNLMIDVKEANTLLPLILTQKSKENSQE